MQHVRFISLVNDYTDKKIVNEAILDGMEAHSKTDGFSKNFEIPIYLAQNFSLINYMKKNKHKVWDANSPSMQISEENKEDIYFWTEGLQPSTFGKSINIMYTVQVRLIYKNFLAKTIKTMTPIFISAPSLTNYVDEFIRKWFFNLLSTQNLKNAFNFTNLLIQKL